MNAFFQNLINRFKVIASISDDVDTLAAQETIRNNIHFRGPNVWILAMSIIIASVGLNVNSIPVIIGAMLISPLMGPIFGIGLGLGISDTVLMKDAFKNLLVMVGIALVASVLYFLLTPLKLSNPSELLARTNPTIFDVIIALFGGLAGVLETCRKEKGTVFAGVAIATALMPPLCTAGYGLAMGKIMYFLGAIYLFCINCIFIILSTYAMVKYLHFQTATYSEARIARRHKTVVTIFLILFIVPSILSAIMLVRENKFDQRAKSFIDEYKVVENSYVYDYRISHHNGSHLELFLAGEAISDEGRRELTANAEKFGIHEDQLVINEHTTRAEDDASMDFFRDIYDRSNREIAEKDARIYELEKQLTALQKANPSYGHLTSEIRTLFPEISSVMIARGQSLTVSRAADSTSASNAADSSAASTSAPVEEYLVRLTLNAPLQDKAKVSDWLKLRLGTDRLTILD